LCAPRLGGPQVNNADIRYIILLADNIGARLQNSEVTGSINKVAVNLVTGQKEIKKIAIDPFIDMESGYPVKANDRIVKIMAAEIMEYPLVFTLTPPCPAVTI